MELVVKPRQAGKSEDILQIAAREFSYIVCPTRDDVARLWARARRQEINIPMPITWDEFVSRRYNGRGIRGFVIDDLDRCVQDMTTVTVKAVSLNGNV